MKKLLVFGIIGFGLFAGWQGLQGVMQAQTLQTIAHDAVDASKGENEKMVRDEILSRATEKKIPLNETDVQVSVVLSDQSGFIDGLTSQGGIRSQKKRINVNIRFNFTIVGIKQTRLVTIEKVLTQQVQMPVERSVETGP